ncbi:Hypothetical predicted protein [Paramuricea clavata]|uniref:Uncharacterized protein n=1 Tax=Paramuricea clavata TaxID=317549 RepID=A0A7D9LJY9_PARCT|nr:Hypothetical predicted protein [Paramuricea clavata]
MAVRSGKTRVRNGVAYEVLNYISSVDLLYDERKKTKDSWHISSRPLDCSQERQRVSPYFVSSLKGWKYFVKWAGYSSFDNTWEPQGHLSPALLRYFEKPDPSQDVVLDCVDRLWREIMSCLKRKGPQQRISIDFRHDVYKFLFVGKGKQAEQRGYILFEENDFSKCRLPKYWNCLFDQHGDGIKINFPVKMRHFLARSRKSFVRKGGRMVEVPCALTEKISLTFVKVAFGC